MKCLDTRTLDIIQQDLDQREDLIRRAVYEALAQMQQPDLSENIVATYFVWTHDLSLIRTGEEICYHMTSGVRRPKDGSLLAQCTGTVVDHHSFDKRQRCGLVRVAFPLRILENEQGDVYSTDILHLVGGAGILALSEHRDAKLVDVAMNENVLERFPGPAYGPDGLRERTQFGKRIAFGTIIKPCTGILPEEEAEIIRQTASNPLFMFIKEDENFLPAVKFAPVEIRVKHALDAVERARQSRGGFGLIFACHVTSPPQLIRDRVQRVLDLGINGLMLSEYYCGGAIRMIREMTEKRDTPPAIYGHNGGITARTRHIYREVLDMFARLDGIDFRQTAPLMNGPSLLRPSGLEWRKCEQILTRPMAGKPAVMIARAGGLDQGNIIQNLMDVSTVSGTGNYLFLAGSAINSIKDDRGNYSPALGSEAMEQALGVFQDCVFSEIDEITPESLKSHADANRLTSLSAALAQRYKLQ